MRTFSMLLVAFVFTATTVDSGSAQSGRDRMEQRMAMKGRMMDRAKHPGMHTKRFGQGGMHVRGRADRR